MFEVKAADIKKMECPEPQTDTVEVKKETIVKQENNNKLIGSYNDTDVKTEIKDPFDCSSDESSCENDGKPFEEYTDKNEMTDFKDTSKVNINMVPEKSPVITDKVGRKLCPPGLLQKHYTLLANGDYGCKHCKFVSKMKKYMNKHVRIGHLKIGKIYQCPYCPYNSRFSIGTHITSRHTKESDIKWYTCHECGHKSKLRSGLQKHVLTHKTTEEKMDRMIKCDLCPKIFCRQYSLTKHTRIVHEKKREVLRCGMCDYHACNKTLLERHMKRVHTDVENLEIFRCDKCNYKTILEYLLKAHSRTKHSPKTLQCEKCPYQAHDMMHMKLHEIYHQEVKNEEDLKYRCDKCEYKTYRQYSLQVHKLKHLKPEEIQYFYCYHCDFKAKRKDNLKTHIKNHFKKKDDFVCFVCDFKTKNKVTHLAHIEKHSKEQKEQQDDWEQRESKKISISSSIGPQKKAPLRGIKKNSKDSSENRGEKRKR